MHDPQPSLNDPQQGNDPALFVMPDSRKVGAGAAVAAAEQIATAARQERTPTPLPDPNPGESITSYVSRVLAPKAASQRSKPEEAIGGVNLRIETGSELFVPTPQLEQALRQYLPQAGYPQVTIEGVSESGFSFHGLSADGRQEYRGRLVNLSRRPGEREPQSKRFGDSIRIEVLNQGPVLIEKAAR